MLQWAKVAEPMCEEKADDGERQRVVGWETAEPHLWGRLHCPERRKAAQRQTLHGCHKAVVAIVAVTIGVVDLEHKAVDLCRHIRKHPQTPAGRIFPEEPQPIRIDGNGSIAELIGRKSGKAVQRRAEWRQQRSARALPHRPMKPERAYHHALFMLGANIAKEKFQHSVNSLSRRLATPFIRTHSSRHMHAVATDGRRTRGKKQRHKEEKQKNSRHKLLHINT